MSKVDKIKKEIMNQKNRLKSLDVKDKNFEEKSNAITQKISILQTELLKEEKSSNEETTKVKDGSTGEQGISKEDINILELSEKIRSLSKDVLYSRYYDKFSRACYFSRVYLQLHFSQFLSSDKNVMVLTGKAGVGKSYFVCELAGNSPTDMHVLLIDSSTILFEQDISIDKYIGGMFGYGCNVLDIFNVFLDENQNSKILIVFDSINESPVRNILLGKLAEFVNSIVNTRLKVILTCRFPIWTSIKRYFTVPLDKGYHTTGPGSYISIDNLDQNEISHAYEIYMRVYNIQTKYCELSSQVTQFISHPLFLRMTAEIYAGANIPKSLALRDVFAKYIEKCLGKYGYESPEFSILREIIELMFENACRELDLAIVRQSVSNKHLMIPDFDSPYTKLIDVGLLSQRATTPSPKILMMIEMVYVTYERIFEYLLAEIIVGDVTTDEILRNLELAKTKSFIQLRGATELALSFSLLNNTTKTSQLIEIARLNQPESRQFLCDVIQTIFDSGHQDIAERVVFEISEDKAIESKYLAVQVAFQLGLDERLIFLTISNNEELREFASLYLFERWNYYRLVGNVNKGYELLNMLLSSVNLRSPKRSSYVFQALFLVTADMFVHIVDDPESVYPIVNIYKKIIDRIPGLNSRDGNISGILTNTTINFIIDIAVKFLKRATTWEELFQDVIGNIKTTRAMLDVGEFLSLNGLSEYKEKIITLITWNSVAIRFISSSLITHQVYCNPDEHFPLFINILDSQKLGLVNKLWVLRALVLGIVTRNFKQLDIPCDSHEILLGYMIQLWYEIKEANQDNTLAPPTRIEDFVNLWEAILFGMLINEANIQRRDGVTKSSEILSKLLIDPTFCEQDELRIILFTLEKTAYQGFIDFALISIIDVDFLYHWEKKVPKDGICSLSSIRALYQQETDSLLSSKKDISRVWSQVRNTNFFPSPQHIRDISTELWTIIAAATDMHLAKLAGYYFLEAALSSSVEDFLKRIVWASIEALSDPVRIDIAHIQWGFAHDPEWDRFDKLEISKEILDTRPELHKHYKELIELCVKKYGHGIFYGNE